MPEWLKFLLADTSALQLVFWIIAIGALIAVIVKLWPALTKFVTIANAVVGLPGFIERTDATLSNQNARIAEIHHETHNNDGSSIKDSVDRLELGVKGLYPLIDALEVADSTHEEHIRELEQTRDYPPKE